MPAMSDIMSEMFKIMSVMSIVYSDASVFIRYKEAVGGEGVGRMELYVITTSQRHMIPTYTRNLNL